jgi:hypothetical protein
MPAELILASAYAIFSLPIAAAGYMIHSARRARRRNEDESCGRCAGTLYAPNTGEGPSLVEGRLYCAPCAAHLRTRTRVALSLAAGHVGLLALLVGGASIGGDASGLTVGLAAIAETSLFAGGAVYLMRRRNRKALRELERRSEVLRELPAVT